MNGYDVWIIDETVNHKEFVESFSDWGDAMRRRDSILEQLQEDGLDEATCVVLPG